MTHFLKNKYKTRGTIKIKDIKMNVKCVNSNLTSTKIAYKMCLKQSRTRTQMMRQLKELHEITVYRKITWYIVYF